MVAEAPKPRVVLVPFAAQGHLTPMIHLAQALCSHGFIPVLTIPDFIHRRMTKNVNSFDQSVELISLPSTREGDGLEEPKNFQAIVNVAENYMPDPFEKVLKGYCDVTCVVVDLLASWAIPVATRCSVMVAGFWPAMMACYNIISAIPVLLHKRIIYENGLLLCDQNTEPFTELNWHFQFPVKLTTKDFPWLIGDSATCASRFHFWLKIIDRAKNLKFILNNSFPGEDGKSDNHFRNGTKNFSQVLQIGPLMRYNNAKWTNPTMWDIDTTCIKWLDLQSDKSVIYVSFGSWVGPIGSDKIRELALGLEKSGRPFLWVLKKEKEWQCGLPEGFLSRVEGRGKIVEWAPQEEVLKHKSIGLYITHCGWNSTMEAIQHAKPLLCYPISGDQFINCSYIVDVWGIGIKLDRIEQNVVRDCIEKAMEGKDGKQMLRKVIDLKRNVIEGSASEKATSNLRNFCDFLRKAPIC